MNWEWKSELWSNGERVSVQTRNLQIYSKRPNLGTKLHPRPVVLVSVGFLKQVFGGGGTYL